MTPTLRRELAGSLRFASTTSAVIALVCCLVAYSALRAQSKPDFSAIDGFWRIHDLLLRDVEPPEAEWKALLETPGYALVQRNIGPVVREDLELAFRPSRAKDAEQFSPQTSARGGRIAHLRLADRERASLGALRDSLASKTPVADALHVAQQYLPPGATAMHAPPPVSFALFAEDAFSLPDGIVVDLMNAHGNVLVPILAHEFHHSYIYQLSTGAPRDRTGPARLADLLYVMRMEGIADQIDKPYPFRGWSPATDAYATQYNAQYQRAPQAIAVLDSLLLTLATDSSSEAAATQGVRRLFWSSGHPFGAYIARTIIETFGRDSILPGTRSPAAFLRTFAFAKKAHGERDPFSPASWRVLDSLEQRYWK